MNDLRRSYVEALAGRLATLEASRDDLNTVSRADAVNAIRRQAHSLRGTGTAYGFPEITAAAHRLEEVSERGLPEALDALIALLQEVRARELVDLRPPNATVLVASADPNLVVGLQRHFPRESGRIASVGTLALATARLDDSQVTVLVVDISLPDGDGRLLISRARRAYGGTRLPIIALSPTADEHVRLECYALGADEFAVKPVGFPALAASIGRKLSFPGTSLESFGESGTSLPGRETFASMFRQNLALAKRLESPVCMALVDIDGLAEIQRRHGRQGRERAQQAVADALQKHLRAADVVARWSSDTFVALLPGSDELSAQRALHRVVQWVREHPPRTPTGERMALTVSAGLGEVRDRGSAAEAVAWVDWFLFAARSGGGDRVICAQDRTHHTRCTVLVAEDDPEAARLLSTRLESSGYSVLRYSDGEAAFAACHDHDISLVVLDIRLPGMDGFEVLSRIRRSSRLGHLPVIMVTAVGDEASIVRAFNDGADDYVVKPYLVDELAARIRRILQPRSKI